MKTMSDRIRERRKELKLTQQALAEMTGVSRVTVTGWESDGYQPNGVNIIALCEALNCDPAWLVAGVGEAGTPQQPKHRIPTQVKEIPLISWVQAGTWTETAPGARKDEAEEWIYTTATVSDEAFALRVRGDSMTNSTGPLSIPEGSIVVVDPHINDISSINGKMVVAYIDGGIEATLKKFVDDWPNRYLVPLNPNYKPIECTERCRIVGQVKQVITNF